VEGDKWYVAERAEKFFKDEIIGPWGKFSNRWWIRSASTRISDTEVDGDKLKVKFHVNYETSGGREASCKATLIFEGKNTGVVKRYELVGAGLEGYKGIWDAAFEPVALELFRNKVGAIECGRLDEKILVNNVLRQAEKIYGVKEGTFGPCMPRRMDGGIGFLIYTNNKPFNPDSGTGRGELWLTFRYTDADIAKGFVKVNWAIQGYWSSGKWTTTEIDKGVLNLLRAAEWKLGA
jgi:hypothetical protein